MGRHLQGWISSPCRIFHILGTSWISGCRFQQSFLCRTFILPRQMYLNLSGTHWWVSDTKATVWASQCCRGYMREGVWAGFQASQGLAGTPTSPAMTQPAHSQHSTGKAPLKSCLVVGFTRNWSMKSHLPWLTWYTGKKKPLEKATGESESHIRQYNFYCNRFWFTGWRWLEDIHGKGREWSLSHLSVGWPREP